MEASHEFLYHMAIESNFRAQTEGCIDLIHPILQPSTNVLTHILKCVFSCVRFRCVFLNICFLHVGGGTYYPPTYEQDGFIHLTADPLKLLGVANHFYKSSIGDWTWWVCSGSKCCMGYTKFILSFYRLWSTKFHQLIDRLLQPPFFCLHSLKIEVASLGSAEVRYEAPAPVGSVQVQDWKGEQVVFPVSVVLLNTNHAQWTSKEYLLNMNSWTISPQHLYGGLTLDCVSSFHKITRDPDGTFLAIEDVETS